MPSVVDHCSSALAGQEMRGIAAAYLLCFGVFVAAAAGASHEGASRGQEVERMERVVEGGGCRSTKAL